MSEAVRRMRAGEVVLEGGFDGEFGVVKLFTPRSVSSSRARAACGARPRPPAASLKKSPD